MVVEEKLCGIKDLGNKMTINYTDKQLRAIHARTSKGKGSKYTPMDNEY